MTRMTVAFPFSMQGVIFAMMTSPDRNAVYPFFTFHTGESLDPLIRHPLQRRLS